jgi:Zn-dependent M28 family amino/carboxypeptidase
VKRNRILNLIAIAAMVMPQVALAQGHAKARSAPAAAQGNAQAIKAAELKDFLYYVASDEMEGRNTPSRGLDTTARFIATNLSSWGLKPAGDDGTYFQKIVLVQNKVDTEAGSVEVGGQKLTFGVDYLPGYSSGTAKGPLVYVGNGWVIKAKNIDPYKNLDIKGKIIVAAGDSFPKGVSFRELQGKQGEDFSFPADYAARHDAAGVILIPSSRTISTWDKRRKALTQPSATVVEKFQQSPNSVPVITLSEKMVTALFAGEKFDGATIFKHAVSNDPVESFELSSSKEVSFTVAAQKEKVMTQNVVAICEGSDPVLKNEYVAIGAHYDHVGIGDKPINGDAIYNGADDDGSGTVSVMAIAEAFAKGPAPKRSILFVWHCGEEKGLWGSRYFTDYPTVPIDQIVTQLNIDMIGRSKKIGDTNPKNAELTGPNEIYVIGSKMMSTELGEVSEAVNKSFLKLSFNYKYDDPKDPNRFFFRSDHFNYAQKGIPIIFYFDGVHEDYHQPSDSPDKIDYQKMEKVARTIYVTGLTIANLPARPKVDKQLPSELTAN